MNEDGGVNTINLITVAVADKEEMMAVLLIEAQVRDQTLNQTGREDMC